MDELFVNKEPSTKRGSHLSTKSITDIELRAPEKQSYRQNKLPMGWDGKSSRKIELAYLR